MTRDATTAFARALVDEWARAGVTDACLAPGSRSAPLALALADDDRLGVHVHLDERSAAFFALGLAKASGRPAVVLSTSGTAAAHFHPAVLEAWHSHAPLLVCTADRPPELRDTGAGQTIDQVKLYGDALRWAFDAPVPDDRPGAGGMWRSLAARAIAEATGPPAGPVQLNLPLREPLVPTGEALVDAPGRADGRPWTDVTSPRRLPDDATVARLADLVTATPRGILVAGWGAGVDPATAHRFVAAAGWPLLADPISGLRAGPQAISTYDALLRVEGFAAAHRPDLVVQIGAAPTSKTAVNWLDPEVAQIQVDPDRGWLDPRRAAAERLAVEPEPLLDAVSARIGAGAGTSDWLDDWLDAERAARRAIDDLLDGWEEPFEGRVARDVVAALPGSATLVVASSMPVRDVESFAAPRYGPRFISNRGVNGIDGFVSTVLGVAAARRSQAGLVVGILGDLAFLHDLNGLYGTSGRGLDATFVVLDNDGGGIFSFLPQRDVSDHFETLFGTPHGLDLVALARACGVPGTRVEKASDVVRAVVAAVEAGGVRVIVVPTDRDDNVRRHREVVAAVTAALTGWG
jgi:2-succinyl-5-enolpyruvyl-6-hydroxy-3-cyclohexene-1-carboxylate synthase